ncbi:hypothetical protein MD484_g5049, partial [Candolleomyces efflorescens]
MDTSMNPLMAAAAAKRAKKEKSALANKRKLNTEEDVHSPRNLLIVRPTLSQPLPSTSTSNPPSKKFRAAPSSSQPLPSRAPNGLSRHPTSSSSSRLRLMQEEEAEAAAEGSDADLERDGVYDYRCFAPPLYLYIFFSAPPGFFQHQQ